MAIYHCSVKIINKTGGKSIIASAAYRSGEKLLDKEIAHTYQYHKPEVIDTEIILPKHAPEAFRNRETLWNSVQNFEKQSNAQLAREFVLAIPKELNQQQGKDLIHQFAQSLTDEGMCVDSSIHWKEGNHHAHILATTRPLKKNGTWGEKERKGYELDINGNKIPLLSTNENDTRIPLLDKNGHQVEDTDGNLLFQKVRIRKGKGIEKCWKRQSIAINEWNKKEKLMEWRERWGAFANYALEQTGHTERIDHRSYKDQGVLLIPTIHEGYAARAIEQNGGISYLCEKNRQIRRINQKFMHESAAIQKEIDRVNKEMDALNKVYEAESGSVTICSWRHLTPNERRSIAIAIPQFFDKSYLKNRTFQRQQKDFLSNAVFARSEAGNIYLLEANKTKAKNHGLLTPTGDAKKIKPKQIYNAAKLAGKELLQASKDMNPKNNGTADGLQSAVNSFADAMDPNKTTKQHADQLLDNVKAVFKTPGKIVQDILSNPLTGILKIPFRATEATLHTLSASANLTGIALSGGQEDVRSRHR